MAHRLLQLAPPHEEYREMFLGGGAMFLTKFKARRSRINDLHPGLYAFWKAVKTHYDEFAEACREQDGQALRSTFDEWTERRDLMTATGDDHLVERAAQYFFINRTVWTGRVVFDPARRSRLYFSNPTGWNHLEKKLANLRACSEKLQRVTLTCKPFEKCLTGSDGDTFIYADPPYVRDSLDTPTSRLYEGHFTFGQHEALRDLLEGSGAKVMVSYDDRPEVHQLYSGDCWRIIPLTWKYCGRHAVSKRDKAAGRKERKVSGRELVIVNYDLPRGGLARCRR